MACSIRQGDEVMPVIKSLLIAVLLGSGARAQDSSDRPVNVVPHVDLNRYMGTWFEIARLPNRFQGKCASDVSATYSLMEDGDVLVVNRCRNENGEFFEAKGVARRSSADGPNSKLEVRFAPSWLSFLPFVWGDYWIMVLAPDYSYVAIGGPDRKYLWIMARTPSMDDATFQGVLDQVKQNGYDLTGLIRTKNSGK
jgi:apolipoprotein D and lipocalin family protein